MAFTRRLFLILAAACIVIPGFFSVLAQKTEDCRTKQEKAAIAGHWKDDQTHKEVDITDTTARYSETHNCIHPDKDGNDVPLPIDFTGVYTFDGHFRGVIYLCRYETDSKHPSAYTFNTYNTDVILTMSDDGMALSGHWRNIDTNTDELISLTRLSKPEYHFRVNAWVWTGTNAQIHAQPSADSEVKYTPAPGTRLMIYATETDENGTPTWYQVSDSHYSVGYTNFGWIPAGQVRCQKKTNKSVG